MGFSAGNTGPHTVQLSVTAEHRREASVLLLRVEALSVLPPGRCRLAGAPALSSAKQNFAGAGDYRARKG